MRKDGLYEPTFLGEITSVIARATAVFLMTVICLSFAAQVSGQTSASAPVVTSASAAPITVSSPNDNKPKLSEVSTLKVKNAYLMAINASEEMQRVQAAVLAQSPDMQRAQAAFQKFVADYNDLVAKTLKQEQFPEGTTLAVDPSTKDVTVKLPETKPEVKK